jgi:hypothetical protein
VRVLTWAWAANIDTAATAAATPVKTANFMLFMLIIK